MIYGQFDWFQQFKKTVEPLDPPQRRCLDENEGR